jgi:hypothetical protein
MSERVKPLSQKPTTKQILIAMHVIHHAMVGSSKKIQLDNPETVTGLLDAILSEIDLLRSGRSKADDEQNVTAAISDNTLSLAAMLVAESCMQSGDQFLMEPQKAANLFRHLAVHLNQLDFLTPLKDESEVEIERWKKERAQRLAHPMFDSSGAGRYGMCINNRPNKLCYLCQVANS